MIRQACMSDGLAWYQLRNQSEMRFWSGSSQAVALLDHAQWFKRALGSPLYVLLVDEGTDGNLRGYARIEIKTVAVVSFAVQQEQRGQGIGTELLWELGRRVMGTPVTVLQALVHPSNLASIRAFFKAGYVPNRRHEGLVILEKSIVPDA